MFVLVEISWLTLNSHRHRITPIKFEFVNFARLIVTPASICLCCLFWSGILCYFYVFNCLRFGGKMPPFNKIEWYMMINECLRFWVGKKCQQNKLTHCRQFYLHFNKFCLLEVLGYCGFLEERIDFMLLIWNAFVKPACSWKRNHCGNFHGKETVGNSAKNMTSQGQSLEILISQVFQSVEKNLSIENSCQKITEDRR